MKTRLPVMQCDDGCGDCCGVIPATEAEYQRVVAFAEKRGIKPQRHEDTETCPFYQKGRCQVYPVRPIICQVFGHSNHPKMACSRGYNVNLPNRKIRKMVLQNGQPTRLLHEALGPENPYNHISVEKVIGS